MTDQEFQRQKNCFDSYESQCTSLPTEEDWTNPLKYAMDAILQNENPHGTFYVHVSAATGIFYEEIHETFVDDTGFLKSDDEDLSYTKHFNFVVPYGTEIHDVSGIIDQSMLERYMQNKESFELFVKDKYDNVVRVPTYCATYPTRENERVQNEEETTSKEILQYSNLGKWWQFARSKILVMDSVVQQTKTLRACAVVEDFTETYLSQPNPVKLMQTSYYHTLKEILDLPHSTQLTEHVLHEYVADVIVARLAICLDKTSELANAAHAAYEELAQTNLADGDAASITTKEDAKVKFQEWRTAVLYYAANDIEHALSTLVLFWRDSYVINLIVDRVSPTLRLSEASDKKTNDNPLCPICALPMNLQIAGNKNCIIQKIKGDEECRGLFYECEIHGDESEVCAAHEKELFEANEDYSTPIDYRMNATIPNNLSESVLNENNGFLVDVGTWRFSPEKHTNGLRLWFNQSVNKNLAEYKGATHITTEDHSITMKISPLLKISNRFIDGVCGAFLPSHKELGSERDDVCVVTFRAKSCELNGRNDSRETEPTSTSSPVTSPEFKKKPPVSPIRKDVSFSEEGSASSSILSHLSDVSKGESESHHKTKIVEDSASSSTASHDSRSSKGSFVQFKEKKKASKSDERTLKEGKDFLNFKFFDRKTKRNGR